MADRDGAEFFFLSFFFLYFCAPDAATEKAEERKTRGRINTKEEKEVVDTFCLLSFPFSSSHAVLEIFYFFRSAEKCYPLFRLFTRFFSHSSTTYFFRRPGCESEHAKLD